MKMEYFESHAHYDDSRFDSDRDKLLYRQLQGAGVTRVINIGADMASSKASIALAERYGYVRASVGVHPHNADEVTDNDLSVLLKLTNKPVVVAVGEIGLDYHYDHSPRDVQRARFRDQLALAKKTGLPVIIHSREAFDDTYKILKSGGVEKGVIHCFSGDAKAALAYIEMGFHIAFGGALTFPKAAEPAEAARVLPLERILIETDCPYITPVPHRGKRNDSRNLAYINDKLAEIKRLSPEETAKATFENGERLFGSFR